MRRPTLALSITLALFATLSFGSLAQAGHATFQDGDLFAGVGKSEVQWRHADGSSPRTLTTAANSPTTAGMAFDPAGRLYVTGFTSNAISVFNPDGSRAGTFGSGFNAHPESISFDDAGNAYIGLASGSRDIRRFGPAGNTSFDVATQGDRGADRLHVGPDNCTVAYTSQGTAVQRYDVCANAQLPNLNAAPLPGTAAQEVRLLEDGGALVADTQAVHRLNAAGAVVATFDAPLHDCWTTLALASTAGAFYAGDACLGEVYRFDLGSGAGALAFAALGKAGSLNGLAVKGEFRHSPPPPGPEADLVVTQEPRPSSVDGANDVLYRVSVANLGPDAATGVSLVDTPSQGAVRLASGEGWDCAISGGSATCTRSELAVGETAPALDIVVRAPDVESPTTLTNTATGDSDQQDPTPADATSTQQTEVGPQDDGTATGYIPPEGGRITTNGGDGATEDDHTYGESIFTAGPGGIASLVEGAQLSICAFAFANCAGDSVDVIVPPGYDDPSQPIRFLLVYDASVAPAGEDPRVVWVSKPGPAGMMESPLLPCLVPDTATPAPCLNGQERTETGDLVIEVLLVSQDPRIQG